MKLNGWNRCKIHVMQLFHVLVYHAARCISSATLSWWAFVLLSGCILVDHLMWQLRPNVSTEESIMVGFQGSQHGVIHDLMLHVSQLCHDSTVLKCNKKEHIWGLFASMVVTFWTDSVFIAKIDQSERCYCLWQ